MLRSAALACAVTVLATQQAAATTPLNSAPSTSGSVMQPAGVFGSLEFPSQRGHPQWQQVLAKIDREARLYADCRKGAASCTGRLRQWQRALVKMRKLSAAGKLREVNDLVNRLLPYQDDTVAFGRADYWASPKEALQRNGDCEDYAILKYASLRQLGFRESQLRLVVLKDLRRNIGHAVLSVRMGNRTIILDNMASRAFEHIHISHYMPVYSLNRQGKWLNLAIRKRRTRVASNSKRRSDATAVIKPASATISRAARQEYQPGHYMGLISRISIMAASSLLNSRAAANATPDGMLIPASVNVNGPKF